MGKEVIYTIENRLKLFQNESKSFDRLQPSIQLLDSTNPTFIEDIKKLDKISPALYCTGHIFYFKKNQHTIQESLTNMVGNVYDENRLDLFV